ncbi:hypothetical protein BCF53_103332 [Reinekea marinisedimentorum]|uniref:Uncharacterized protein n=1 Tax=Reinekea marinisedimentorum TaxID=230495 RepID=A0A4R3I939_9GAMM|nr:hypothetical protein BCF53_103332 [Reinekea marinisedimentorum]
MERNEPDRPSLTAFVKVVNDSNKSNRQAQTISNKQTWRTDTSEEVTVQGVAILSNN